MEIVVCLKQIVDPEIPASEFRLDPVTKRQIRGSHALVISTYDENALEVALQLKEKQGGKVTAVTIGEEQATEALRKALAMGADSAVLISDPPLLEADDLGKARVLARAIRKLTTPDLILCGCESADWVSRIVGPFLAEELGLPCVTFGTRIEPRDGKIVVRRIVEDGYHLVEAALPAVVTIASDETNTPRLPKVRDIMAAVKKPITLLRMADLGIEPGSLKEMEGRIVLQDVAIPVREARCEFIEGDTPEEQAERLVLRLKELKVI
ncbi:MAG: electron transfer flavoprotein subunit beta/FixA family protein [Armatimonadota bacterium]|nr:electron transfer flavoprotein subunit beta/FixA family protein [Armatimonadota bacterium]